MAEDPSEEIIEKYVKKVLLIQEAQNNDVVKQEDIDSLRKELQLDDRELAIIENEFTGHYERGMGFMRHGNWKSATDEYEQAIALKPFHESSITMMAAANQELFYDTGKAEYKEKAIAISRRCLRLNSQNQHAYKIITELEKGGRKAKVINKAQKRFSKGSLTRNLLFVAVLLAVMIFFGGVVSVGKIAVFFIIFLVICGLILTA